MCVCVCVWVWEVHVYGTHPMDARGHLCEVSPLLSPLCGFNLWTEHGWKVAWQQSFCLNYLEIIRA